MHITRRDDGKFLIDWVSPTGQFRGVRDGDTFTYDGQRYEVVGKIDSLYNGILTYIVAAELAT